MGMTKVVKVDQTNQFCSRCGTKMETLEGERAKICLACRLINYPRISPAVITAVIRGNKILLTHDAAFRGNIHSLIAGFVDQSSSNRFEDRPLNFTQGFSYFTGKFFAFVVPEYEFDLVG